MLALSFHPRKRHDSACREKTPFALLTAPHYIPGEGFGDFYFLFNLRNEAPSKPCLAAVLAVSIAKGRLQHFRLATGADRLHHNQDHHHDPENRLLQDK